MTRIVYLGAPEGFGSVRALAGDLATVEHTPANADAVAAALPSCAALIDASMKVAFDEAMLARADALRVISTATTGSDHIDADAADRRGITVKTLREDGDLLRGLTPAAELSWALVLACARRLVPAIEHARAGRWEREEFPGLMLNGRTLGLIGCGRIGQWMGRYGRAFGMGVLGFDPHVEPWPDGIERVELDALATQSDVISVHVHLNTETRGLVGASVFERMKTGTIFVNTSRGGLCDEAALLRALESGRLGAAGLDVLDGEPETEAHPLVRYAQNHDNLLITPHCGGFSPDAVRRVCARAAEKALTELGLGPT